MNREEFEQKVRSGDIVASTDMVKIIPKRRAGNSTRIMDNAIQQLFDGKIVIVKEWMPQYKRTMKINEMLAERIKKRIKLEHGYAFSLLKQERFENHIMLRIEND